MTTSQANLVKFLIDDRNEEVHGIGSCRGQKLEEHPIGNMYSDSSGTVYASWMPGTQPPSFFKPVYGFTIDGVERQATEVCAEYYWLLHGMVAKFKADHP